MALSTDETITPRATRSRVREEQCAQENRRADALSAACLLLCGNLPATGPLDPARAAMDIADVFVAYINTGRKLSYREAELYPQLADLMEKGDVGT